MAEETIVKAEDLKSPEDKARLEQSKNDVIIQTSEGQRVPFVTENPSGGQRVIKPQVGEFVIFAATNGRIRALNTQTGEIVNPEMLSGTQTQGLIGPTEAREIARQRGFNADQAIDQEVSQGRAFEQQLAQKGSDRPISDQSKATGRITRDIVDQEGKVVSRETTTTSSRLPGSTGAVTITREEQQPPPQRESPEVIAQKQETRLALQEEFERKQATSQARPTTSTPQERTTKPDFFLPGQNGGPAIPLFIPTTRPNPFGPAIPLTNPFAVGKIPQTISPPGTTPDLITAAKKTIKQERENEINRRFKEQIDNLDPAFQQLALSLGGGPFARFSRAISGQEEPIAITQIRANKQEFKEFGKGLRIAALGEIPLFSSLDKKLSNFQTGLGENKGFVTGLASGIGIAALEVPRIATNPLRTLTAPGLFVGETVRDPIGSVSSIFTPVGIGTLVGSFFLGKGFRVITGSAVRSLSRPRFSVVESVEVLGSESLGGRVLGPELVGVKGGGGFVVESNVRSVADVLLRRSGEKVITTIRTNTPAQFGFVSESGVVDFPLLRSTFSAEARAVRDVRVRADFSVLTPRPELGLSQPALSRQFVFGPSQKASGAVVTFAGRLSGLPDDVVGLQQRVRFATRSEVPDFSRLTPVAELQLSIPERVSSRGAVREFLQVGQARVNPAQVEVFLGQQFAGSPQLSSQLRITQPELLRARTLFGSVRDVAVLSQRFETLELSPTPLEFGLRTGARTRVVTEVEPFLTFRQLPERFEFAGSNLPQLRGGPGAGVLDLTRVPAETQVNVEFFRSARFEKDVFQTPFIRDFKPTEIGLFKTQSIQRPSGLLEEFLIEPEAAPRGLRGRAAIRPEAPRRTDLFQSLKRTSSSSPFDSQDLTVISQGVVNNNLRDFINTAQAGRTAGIIGAVEELSIGTAQAPTIFRLPNLTPAFALNELQRSTTRQAVPLFEAPALRQQPILQFDFLEFQTPELDQLTLLTQKSPSRQQSRPAQVSNIVQSGSQASREEVISFPVIAQVPFQNVAQEPVQTPFQALRQTPKSPGGPPGTPFIPLLNIPPPPPIIPDFGFPGFEESSRRPGPSRGPGVFRGIVEPSLTALVFNIRGLTPKTLTGFELRPIQSAKSKKKKERRGVNLFDLDLDLGGFL